LSTCFCFSIFTIHFYTKKGMKKVTLLTAFMLIAIGFGAKANNITVSNISLSGQNTASDFTLVGFDVSWSNSWRTSTNESNYDGAWIFVKWRKKGTSEWKHASINYVAPGDATSCGHTAATGSTVQTVADGRGIFIYRDADGVGDITFAGNSIRWNYGADGVLDNDSVDINVYAVEMVYIPQGGFTLGSSSATDYNGFSTYGASGVAANEYIVSSEAAINVGATAGSLYYTNNGTGFNTYYYGGGDNAGPIPADFPKGYDAFWMMKYETSQQQYADFLNALDFVKASNRLTVASGTHPNYMMPNPERAMSATSNIDALAYTDWAGLRPMTELEYEKACRGANITPIGNEYAWGNTTITVISGISNSGAANETASIGNCIYNGSVPARCGIFATSTSNRQSSGGTYYGAMEMSGNLWERAVPVGVAASRLFTRSVHGDGNLATTGTTDIAIWNAMNLGFRGGGHDSPAQFCQTSDRSNAAGFIANNVTRQANFGFRCARTAE
jgi:formylglycine-generating enzyme required for sulfatase activity